MFSSIQKWRSKHPNAFRPLTALLLAIIGGALRIYLVQNSLDDWDEDEYIIAAKDFREIYDRGDWEDISNVEFNAEHPPLVKMLYAVTLDEQELNQIPQNHFPGTRAEPPLPRHSLENARYQSAAFGVLTIFVVGWISPLAGIILIFHTLFLRFTTAAYLDALPVFFSALAVIFYIRMRLPTFPETKAGKQFVSQFSNTYWFLSAACMGIAVAAKYPYGLIAVVVAIHALYNRYSFGKVVLWGLIALMFFFVLNPYIWPDPISRIKEQLTYHQEYAERNGEQHDFFKPFDQLTNPRQLNHRNDDFLPHWPMQIFEWAVFALAAVGTVVMVRHKAVIGWWLVAGMVFLMLWSTQWVQHKMLILVPYSFAAGAGFQWLRQQVIRYRQRASS